MKTLTVDLGSRSYPIHIGSGLLKQPELVQSLLPGRQVMLVSNETIAPLYMDSARALFDGCKVQQVVLPDGEEHKRWPVLMRIFDALLEARHDRRTTLVALGGGVVGDMTGYAAASYQRGVAFLQLPTTLLSQVDSSVGGKTGINHPAGKNMIGAFHQPLAVLADTDTLQTLPPRELAAGLAEVIKYGLLGDAEFLVWLEAHLAALLAGDAAALSEAIARSCANKARIVAADEREAGQRALLNLGHTFGHAIEAHMSYREWLHGEAVAVGMCMAADLSQRLGWLTAADVDRTRRLVAAAGLPVTPPAGMQPADFLQHMAVDKKVQDGQLRLVLLKALGDAVVTSDFAASSLEQTLSACAVASG